MVQVDDGRRTDRVALPLRMHRLALALAGRIDDSGLADIRELSARARLDEAAELTVGILIAGRLPVRASEQRELAELLELSQSEASLADELMVREDDAVRLDHRFTDINSPAHGVEAALKPVLGLLPDVRAVRAVWRNTPAGAVGGALPHRLVLVEIGPDGSAPATTYRVANALTAAEINAAVEVLEPDVPIGAYHQRAWEIGAEVSRGDGVQQRESVQPQESARTTVVQPVAAPGTEKQSGRRYRPEPEPVQAVAGNLGAQQTSVFEPAQSYAPPREPAYAQMGRVQQEQAETRQEGGEQQSGSAHSAQTTAQTAAQTPVEEQSESQPGTDDATRYAEPYDAHYREPAAQSAPATQQQIAPAAQPQSAPAAEAPAEQYPDAQTYSASQAYTSGEYAEPQAYAEPQTCTEPQAYAAEQYAESQAYTDQYAQPPTYTVAEQYAAEAQTYAAADPSAPVRPSATEQPQQTEQPNPATQYIDAQAEPPATQHSAAEHPGEQPESAEYSQEPSEYSHDAADHEDPQPAPTQQVGQATVVVNAPGEVDWPAPGELFQPQHEPPHPDDQQVADYAQAPAKYSDYDSRGAEASYGEDASQEPGARVEGRAESTADLSAEVAQVRAAMLAKNGVPADGSDDDAMNSLEDPRLSERDRALLRQLHAELAKRERAEVSNGGVNGREHAEDSPPWARFGKA